jgi:hypothetical protein
MTAKSETLARDALKRWEVLPDNPARWGRAFGLTPGAAQRLVDAEKAWRARS